MKNVCQGRMYFGHCSCCHAKTEASDQMHSLPSHSVPAPGQQVLALTLLRQGPDSFAIRVPMFLVTGTLYYSKRKTEVRTPGLSLSWWDHLITGPPRRYRLGKVDGWVEWRGWYYPLVQSRERLIILMVSIRGARSCRH